MYLLGSGAKERDPTPQALPQLYSLIAHDPPELTGDVLLFPRPLPVKSCVSTLHSKVLIVCATQSESLGPWSSCEILFLQCR